MTLARVLSLTVAHFVLAYAAATIAYGWDLDRVFLDPVSRAAALLHTVLMVPHDAFLRLVPSFAQGFQSFVLLPVLVNSLLWGVGLSIVIWLADVAWQRTRPLGRAEHGSRRTNRRGRA